MLIARIMRRDVATLPTSTPASEAWALMRKEGLRHLLVVTRGKLVGIVSDRDLGGARGGALRRGRTVGDLMTPDVVTVGPRSTVAVAARKLRSARIGCLAVLVDGRVVGIVTRSDLLSLLDGHRGPGDVTPRHAGREPRLETLVSPNVDKHL